MSEREEIDAKVRTWRVVAVWIWARVREAEAAVGRSARDGSVMAEILYEMPWRYR
jgi:2-keto-3-deoxy-6-phosphogluconate aldolase